MMHLYTFIQRNCVFMLAFFDTTDCRGLSEPNQARVVGTVLTQELSRAVCVCGSVCVAETLYGESNFCVYLPLVCSYYLSEEGLKENK